MAAKQKTKAKKQTLKVRLNDEQQSRLAAWLNLAGADREAALAGLIEAVETEPDLAEAMALALGGVPSGDSAWIAGLAGAEVKNKAVRKALKKSAYQLRNKGLEAASAPAGGGVFKTPQTPPAKGYLTGYHPDGNQLLYLCLTAPGGRSAGGALVVHFVKGIQEASFAHMRLSQLDDMIGQTQDELSLPPAEVSEKDLMWLLGHALALNRDRRNSLNTEASFISGWLNEKKFQAAGPAPIWARMGLDPAAEPEVAALRRIKALLEEPPCQMWWVDMDRWAEARPSMEDGLESGLVLSQAQLAEKATALLERLKPILFPPEEMPCWRHRLEETALYMESNGRTEEAIAFLNAALAPGHPENPLFEALMTRVWNTEQALKEQMAQTGESAQPLEADQEPDNLNGAGESSGLILPPGVKV